MRKIIAPFIPLLVLAANSSNILAQGTAFTYQGQLYDGSGPANGTYDLKLELFNASSGGSLVAGPVTNTPVVVSNGLFTTLVDCGAGVFNGATSWLQIGVRTNGGAGFTGLTPRQQIMPVPYSIYSENAGVATEANTLAVGAVSPPQLNTPGAPSNGQVLGFNGSSLVWTSPASASFAWNLTGNAGTDPTVDYLGTSDSQPLELHVNTERALRLEYVGRTISSGPILTFEYGINLNGGFWNNTISNGVLGATIAGGGQHFGPVFSGTDYPNIVNNDFGSIGGGYGNTAGFAAVVPGGYFNIATGNGSFAAGRYAQTANAGSFIWSDGTLNPFTSSGANCFDVLASGGIFFANGSAGVNIDQLNLNSGSLSYGLRFGIASGEGIASKRSAGTDQYGLDFYTSFANRMTIANNGFVGINTVTPAQQLDVNGEFLVVDGFGGEQAYLGGDGVGNYVQVGSLNPNVANVAFYNAANNTYMHIYCSSITINGGADLAEPFQISCPDKVVEPGTVVVIDEENPGHLKGSERPYDTRVAGVVSGANGVKPGIQLRQTELLDGGQNVALTGRVYVRADATYGAIQPGDLLTTSATPGHAMKVADHSRAQGAILGKAMSGLSEGRGLVLVLVTLQ